jgi:hypothetical protein
VYAGSQTTDIKIAMGNKPFAAVTGKLTPNVNLNTPDGSTLTFTSRDYDFTLF